MSRLTLIAVLLFVCTCASAQPLPSGWRLPTDKDLSDEARNDSAARFARTAADFNGDGVEDQALLLKAEKGNVEALWVWLSDSRGGHRWILLNQIKWPKQYSEVPLTRARELEGMGKNRGPHGC